jgi:ABC-2 type transport system ATP-binding protein
VERVHLAEVWNQRIDSLSKGFKRRVAIAQALVHDPDVLILDEPTDGLDPNQKYEMRALIRAIAPHKAIVVSTHILEEVEAVCSRAIIIARGRLLADAVPAVLLAGAADAGSIAVTLATGDPQRAIEVISRQPGVLKVAVAERMNGLTRLLVHAAASRPSATSLAGVLEQADIAAEEIYLRRPTLDDVFREITTATEH